MVKYTYNAWGEHTVSGSLASTVGEKNLFRYRSYFYDTETKLYFLKTRYYDPLIGRFLNMDSIAYADPETINGLNLYAYCGNNPVMNIDPTGQFVLTSFVIGLAITVVACTVAGAVVGGVSSASKGESISAGIGKGALLGLMLGGSAALIATGVGTPLAGGLIGTMAVGAGVGSAVSLMGNLNSQLSTGGVGSLNLNQAAQAWGIGAGVGAIAGGTSYAFSALCGSYGTMFGSYLSSKTFLGVSISKVISFQFMSEIGGILGGFLGGYMGGTLINYLATDSNYQDGNVPMWLVSLIRILGKI